MGALALLADFVLVVKVVAFVPDNIWIWRFGPEMRSHESHAPQSPPIHVLEAEGTDGSCLLCSTAIPSRPLLSMKLSGLLEYPTTAGERLLKVLLALISLLFWTPFVAVFGLVSVEVLGAQGTVQLLVHGASAGLLGFFTLCASIVLRLSLGSKDIEHSDIRGFVRFFGRRIDSRKVAAREGLALYFAAMILVAIACFAQMYLCIARALPSSFEVTGGSSWLDWIYFSVGVMSTSADGQITALNEVAKLAVMAQLLSGPLLIFWFVSLFIAGE